MENLITRLGRMGFLFVIGFLLIIYIAFAFIYLQQAPQQSKLKEQITKLSLVVARPLPSAEKLRAEYDEVNRCLAPMTDTKAIDTLVGIAKENGIDVDLKSGKLDVPSAARRGEKMGGGNYQVLSFKGISVQADYDNVMAFISDLDSGKTAENMTMVLKRVVTREVEVPFSGEEKVRRDEFRNVVSKVIAMMTGNALSEIPVPVARASDGTAVNDMTAFPDVTTTAADKGADDTFMTDAGATEVLGYLLYGHQLIVDVDGDGVYDATDGVKIVNYVTMETTTYYYTCEADGTVRQFDGANVVTATEYLTSEESKIETEAIVDIDIYTKPEE